MCALKRIEIDDFKIDEAISLEELEENKGNQEFLNNKILNMEDIFKNLSNVILDNTKKEKFLNGVKLNMNLEDGLYNIYSEKYIGLGTVQNGLLKRDVVIN